MSQLMVFAGLLLAVVSLDLAKACKPVNYNFKHYGFKSEYITGCKKGCFLNDTMAEEEKKAVYEIIVDGAQTRPEVKKCTPCSDIKEDTLPFEYNKNDGPPFNTAEFWCNEQLTCHWQGGKCRAVSCPLLVRKEKCGRRFYDCLTDSGKIEQCGWRDGKCKEDPEKSASDCKKDCDNQYEFDIVEDPDAVPPHQAVPGADKIKAQCKYICDHPDYKGKESPPGRHLYEYTKTERKYAHRVLGCLYAKDNVGNSPNYRMTSSVQSIKIKGGYDYNREEVEGFDFGAAAYGRIYPSRWSIWAFVLTLVLLILFAIGVIAAITVLVFVGGSDS